MGAAFTSEQVALPDGSHTMVEWFGHDATSDKGLVVFLPALGVNVQYYRGFAAAWAGRGYRVATVEMRGMKQSSVRDVKRHNFGYNEVLNIDLATLIPALTAGHQGRPVYLAGHSLGAQFALMHASRYPQGLAGIVAFAGGSNYYATLPSAGTRLKRHAGVRAVSLINRALGFFPGDKLGFGGRQPLNLMKDWACEALTGRYAVIGDATDYNRAFEKIDVPVLLLSLSGDALVPRPCADFLANKLQGARVTQVELQARDYSLKAFSHFGWVKKPEILLEQVALWEQGARGAGAR